MWLPSLPVLSLVTRSLWTVVRGGGVHGRAEEATTLVLADGKYSNWNSISCVTCYKNTVVIKQVP